jgi:hypothetical protein
MIKHKNRQPLSASPRPSVATTPREAATPPRSTYVSKRSMGKKTFCPRCERWKMHVYRGACRTCHKQSAYRAAVEDSGGSDRQKRVEPPTPNRGDDMRPPSSPTAHPPGSEGKIEELSKRLWAGELLWHPRDATFEQCCCPPPPSLRKEEGADDDDDDDDKECFFDADDDDDSAFFGPRAERRRRSGGGGGGG